MGKQQRFQISLLLVRNIEVSAFFATVDNMIKKLVKFVVVRDWSYKNDRTFSAFTALFSKMTDFGIISFVCSLYINFLTSALIAFLIIS